MMNLIEILKEHEGSRPFAYQDSRGFWTIGVGRNIDKHGGMGLSESEIEMLLINDVNRCKAQLNVFPFYQNLNLVRQEVIVELCFNMGWPTLMQFKKMIAALKLSDFTLAVEELKNSLWAKEVSAERVQNMTQRLLTGSYDDPRGYSTNSSSALD